MPTLRRQLSAFTLRTMVFSAFLLSAAFGLMPRQAIAITTGGIVLPSSSIEVYGQRPITVTVTNTSADIWPANTMTPKLVYFQKQLMTTVTGVDGWGNDMCSNYRVSSVISTVSLSPIPVEMEPGSTLTLPAIAVYQQLGTPGTWNGTGCRIFAGNYEGVYVRADLTTLDKAIPSAPVEVTVASVTANLYPVSYAGILSITPSAPTSFPEVSIPLTATVTYVGQAGLLMFPNCSLTTTRLGKMSISLFAPDANNTTVYSLPVTLPVSPGQTIVSSLSIPAPTVAGPYLLKSTTVTYDAFPQCTGLGAAGLSLGGSPTSTDTVLKLTVNPVTLIAAPLVKSGWSASSAITWPTSVTHSAENTNCGTKPTQSFIGTSGTCTYALPGDYNVTGSYITKDGRMAVTKASTVKVPFLTPSTGALKLTVNGQSAPDDALMISRYRTPMSIAMDIALDLPSGAGIVDQLNLSTSVIQVLKKGELVSTSKLTAGVDPLHLTATLTLDAGETTLQLNAHTMAGTPVSFSRTFSLEQIPVVLTGSAPVQVSQDVVSSTLAFPADSSITPVNIDCGTTNFQTIAAASVVCRYTKPGVHSAVGSFLPIGESGNSPVLTQVFPVNIVGVAPSVQLGISMMDINQTKSPITIYSAPVPVVATLNMERQSSIIGILDAIDPTTVKLTFGVTGEALLDLISTQRSALYIDAPANIPSIGSYSLHLEAATITGKPIKSDFPFVVAISKVQLSLSELRTDPLGVALDIAFPAGVSGGVLCGDKDNHRFEAHAGTCKYKAPGTYILKGSFRDPLTSQLVKTVDQSYTVPSVSPTSVIFKITHINGAPLSDQTEPLTVIRIDSPSAFPLAYAGTFTSVRAPLPVGVPTPFDPSRSIVTASPLQGGMDDSAKSRKGDDLAVYFFNGTVRNILPDPQDSSSWASRLTLYAFTANGESFSKEIILRGPIGGGQATSISLEIQKNLPKILFAPASYRYQIKRIATPTRKEPVTLEWNIKDSEGKSLETGTGMRFLPTLPLRGDYKVSLLARGPFSGTQLWEDSITAPELPPPGAPVIKVQAPSFQRPPATYRFSAQPARFADSREKAGIGEWNVDGVVKGNGGSFITTFDAAGTYVIGVKIKTTYGRLLTAESTVVVNENQLPVGTIDCSKSVFVKSTATYTLVCQTEMRDPDGKVVGVRWIIPSLSYDSSGNTRVIVARTEPFTATVELHLKDNSGAESVKTFDVDSNTFIQK